MCERTGAGAGKGPSGAGWDGGRWRREVGTMGVKGRGKWGYGIWETGTRVDKGQEWLPSELGPGAPMCAVGAA